MNNHVLMVTTPGPPEALTWTECEVSVPGPGEVLLKQAAVGLNFIDVYHRMGLYPQALPFTPGMEAAGTVEAVGAGVTRWQPGDRVAYAGAIGAYAERRVVAADTLVGVPDGITVEQAAAVLLQGMTAQMLLKQVTTIRAGDTILVHAAAGGVGLILCQWAAALGATVIGTVSTRAKAELVRAHGCAHPVVTGDGEDFVAVVDQLTGGTKLPVVYDSVGADTFLRSLDCLRPRGLMVSFGQVSGPVAPFSPLLLSQKGSLFLTRPTLFNYTDTPATLAAAAADLWSAIERGIVHVTIGQSYPLRDAARAHADLEARRTTGSTVLVP